LLLPSNNSLVDEYMPDILRYVRHSSHWEQASYRSATESEGIGQFITVKRIEEKRTYGTSYIGSNNSVSCTSVTLVFGSEEALLDEIDRDTCHDAS
jgi:hypothetical protein